MKKKKQYKRRQVEDDTLADFSQQKNISPCKEGSDMALHSADTSIPFEELFNKLNKEHIELLGEEDGK